MVKLGCLSSLQELTFHITERVIHHEKLVCRKCMKLFNFNRESSCGNLPWDQLQILKPIADGLEQVVFPSLTTIHLCLPFYITDNASAERRIIRNKGVSVLSFSYWLCLKVKDH